MKQKLLLSAILIFISAFIFAQDSITVSGKILDDKKQPLPGATVMVKGTGIGTATDDAGKYSLRVPKDAKTIVISYVGFDSKEMPLTPGQTQFNLQMLNSENSLNQVVISVSKHKEKLLDAPASISVIGQTELERNVVTSLVDELKTTPGVDIMQTGLISRNVVVRGFNDIFSGNVLNVVDNRIGSVPSLRVNAYQLIPVIPLDLDRIEVVRGPASALYGPNASAGVISIMTKSPLDQEKLFETTVAMTSGFTVLDKSYRQYNNGHALSGNILNPELRFSGKLRNGIFGYKVSGTYFQGQDYPNFDPREPYKGDSLLFGSVHNGNIFSPDTLGYNVKYDSVTHKNDSTAKLDIRRMNKNFFIRRYAFDVRLDFRPTKDMSIVINGGLSNSHNIELTGLGAGVAGGESNGWNYWYAQARFKWKNLFIQYFINASDAGNTYLIPQLSQSARQSYGATSPPTPYDVQLLVDKSKLHVVQIQHSWAPIEKLNFVYGVDGLFTRPSSKGTIYGRFEPVDAINQVGGYLQGTYDPVKWFTLVGAVRVDYNSVIKNVAVSPRAAAVFKVADNQNIRLTYNRAYDAPTTLDQFLDLSQALLPNNMNARGIGNPYGYNYQYDPTGNIQYRTAPWGGAQNSGQWVTFNSTAGNVAAFDSFEHFLIKNLATSAALQAYGGDPVANATSFVKQLFAGIDGPTGTVANAKLNALNLNNYGSTNDYKGSLIANPTAIGNLKKVNNQYTQTLELGYKGLVGRKLSIQVDGYWTRITNAVSALTPASEAVVLNNAFLGKNDTSGILYKNLNHGLAPIFSALDGATSLQNPTITQPVKGSAWDELVVLISQLPIGTITPNSPYVNSDYILTYENLGKLDVFGADLGLNYLAYQTDRHDVSAGASFSFVNRDHFDIGANNTYYLNAPKIKAAVMFDHVLKKSGFGYGLTFRYQQGYYASSSVYFGQVKPMYIPDLRISYKPKFYKGLLLSINVNNFINYQWQSFPGTPLMGASLYARAQVTF